MKTFQPWQDIIPLLAGAKGRQRRPLGEVFAPSATVEHPKRGRLSLKLMITRLLSFAAARGTDTEEAPGLRNRSS